jgi:hypothetical protein
MLKITLFRNKIAKAAHPPTGGGRLIVDEEF